MNQSNAEQTFDDPTQDHSASGQVETTEQQPAPGGLEATLVPAEAAVGIDGPYQEPRSSHHENDQSNLDLIMKIPVEVQVILGTTKMPVAKLMKLGRNAVIALDRQVGDPIDVVVNGQIVARGEVVLMEDDSSRFGISLTEVVGSNVSDQ